MMNISGTVPALLELIPMGDTSRGRPEFVLLDTWGSREGFQKKCISAETRMINYQ